MSKLLFFVVIGALPLVAQSNAGSSAGASGTGVPSGTTSTRVPTPTPTTPQMPSTASPAITMPPRPIFLSGTVKMDDGMPVPANVVIQRVCASNTHAVAYTDSKGHFSFQWGQTNGVFLDASESSAGLRDSAGNSGFGSNNSSSALGRMSTDPYGPQLMNCELQASLPGYRSDSVRLFNHTSGDNPDIGMIVLHRLGNVEGSSISATSLLAPKDAKKSFDRAQQALAKGKTEDAVKEFEKAVAVYPKYADAWAALGKIQIRQKSNDAAREAFLKAVEADSKLVFPYVQLGLMSADKGKWEEASGYLDRATKLDPVDYPHVWYVSAVANYNLKRFDAAEKSAREVLKLDPKRHNPRADYLLGLILVEKHDYVGAASQLKVYLDSSPSQQDLALAKAQLGQIESFIAAAESPK